MDVWPDPPNWGNDSLFFWTRLIDFIFILAVPGAYLVDEWAGVVATSIQLAISSALRVGCGAGAANGGSVHDVAAARPSSEAAQFVHAH
jgi:hypothetical protein